MTSLATHQPSLFDPDAETLEERFEAAHTANPGVYRELVRRARRLKRLGLERYSIKGLFEVVRYDRGVRTAPARTGSGSTTT